jgi:mannose-6-phosphate isomerase-like protein (cupin superfamily)
MKTILSADRPLVAASHENPLAPGAWKKVLFERADFQAGVVQMVNWARLPVGKGFAAHYHEDLQEIFIIICGVAELTAGPETVVLRRGDAVLIDPREVHQMRTQGDEEVEYLVVGISAGQGGRTVVVSAQ